MDVEKIIVELKNERDRLEKAIEALEGIGPRPVAVRVAVSPPPAMGRNPGGLTPAGRKRLSEAMKRRWAERRKKA